MSKEKFYITTAIDYVNAPLHIGHALEKVQADVIARYQRTLGKDVYFLTGADEHGAKVARAAQKSNRNIKEFVDENVKNAIDLLKKLNISYDDFIRTSDEKRHYPAAKEVWKRIEAKGDIYKKNYKGLYCVGHEAFVTEKDLKEGICEEHGSAPELIEEENYFFRLSKYADQIKKAISSNELKVIPEERKKEILSFIEEGVEDISVSRPSKDISWAVPVPEDAAQTMYVWFEALINYISALGFDSKDSSKFNKFWPADLHVVGKDVLRFHSLIWPAMLLSAKIPLPREIFVHGFVTVGGKKMSKTLGNIIDPLPLIDEYGEDALRAYLIREIPVFDDGDYTEEKFKNFYNGNMARGLGNYVSRVSAMGIKYFGGEIKKPTESAISAVPLKKHISFPTLTKKHEDIESMRLDQFIENKIWPAYRQYFSEYEIGRALNLIFELMKVLDNYVQEYEPFKLIEKDKEKTEALLWNLCYASNELAFLLKPFMPGAAEKILKIFAVAPSKPVFEQEFKITPHEILFPAKE